MNTKTISQQTQTIAKDRFNTTAVVPVDAGRAARADATLADTARGVAKSATAVTPFLPRVAFLGRSIADYREMFALPRFPEGFVGTGKRVLDVAAGSAAFASEAMAAGAEVVAVDPLYDRTAAALAQISQYDLQMSFAALGSNPQVYKQSGRGLDLLRARREQSRAHFLADYPVGLALGRYRKAELPHLPFEDDAFDLALCGNLLFLYAHLLDAQFHRRALDELLRVAKEVRVYPLFQLDGQTPPFLGELIESLENRELDVQVEDVHGAVLRAQARVLIVRRP